MTSMGLPRTRGMNFALNWHKDRDSQDLRNNLKRQEHFADQVHAVADAIE
jgi:hypothetical protein